MACDFVLLLMVMQQRSLLPACGLALCWCVAPGKTSLILELADSLRVVWLTLARQEPWTRTAVLPFASGRSPTCSNLHSFIVLWILSL